MTQTSGQQSNSSLTMGENTLSNAPAADDPPPGSGIPLHCSLQWDAMSEAGREADAAIKTLEDRMKAFMECLERGPEEPWQWPPPAPGGEYVDATEPSPATASTVVAVTVSPLYRLGQIEAIRGTIAGCRRHLKHILGITK
jgi:hypothetical protein